MSRGSQRIMAPSSCESKHVLFFSPTISNFMQIFVPVRMKNCVSHILNKDTQQRLIDVDSDRRNSNFCWITLATFENHWFFGKRYSDIKRLHVERLREPLNVPFCVVALRMNSSATGKISSRKFTFLPTTNGPLLNPNSLEYQQTLSCSVHFIDTKDCTLYVDSTRIYDGANLCRW